MLKKVYSLKGLHLRDSDINRPPEYASDLKNVEKNIQGEIRQRWGVDDLSVTFVLKDGIEVPTSTTIIDLFEYIGDGQNKELLALVQFTKDNPNTPATPATVNTSGLFKLTGSILKEIPNMQKNPVWVGTERLPNWTKPTKTVEYNRVLYWNDPDDSKEFADIEHLWKYDGFRISRAGAPKPKITSNVLAGTTFYRVLMLVRDGQSNTTWSEFEQIDDKLISGTWDIPSIMDPYYDGFVQRFGLSLSPVLINSGALTLTVDTATHAGPPHHNFEVGDQVLSVQDTGGTIEGYSGSTFAVTKLAYLEVESVTATTITYTAASVGTFDWLVGAGPIDKTYGIEIYNSADKFFNYTKSSVNPLFPQEDDATITSIIVIAPAVDAQILTEVYDDSFIRQLPPKAKYWTTFGNHLVSGALLSGVDSDGNIINAGATTADNTLITDNIQWSDFPTSTNGATVETFNPDYVFAVGVSNDGPIIALHGNDDSLAVHKGEQSYYVYGDFISATLRTRKTQTAEIGAASHRSIEEVDGGHIYITPKGMYGSTGGQPPKEISDIIQPLFGNDVSQPYDLTNSKSINDFYNEKIYTFLPYTGGNGGDILVFDYYYKEWYLHDSLDAIGGFISIVDKIYISDGTNLYLRNSESLTDAGSKINSYYTTGWFDLDAPTLLKKWVRFILISAGVTNWIPTITTQCNWAKEDVGGFELEITDDIKVDDGNLPNIKTHSMRLKIASTNKKEGLLITGYEVEFELTQSKPKGMR